MIFGWEPPLVTYTIARDAFSFLCSMVARRMFCLPLMITVCCIGRTSCKVNTYVEAVTPIESTSYFNLDLIVRVLAYFTRMQSYIKRFTTSAFSFRIRIRKGELSTQLGFHPIHRSSYNIHERHGFNKDFNSIRSGKRLILVRHICDIVESIT